VAAGLTVFAGPASAQAITTPDQLSEAQMDELYCFYDRLSDDANARVVVLHAMTGSNEYAEESAKAEAAAEAACVAKYKWTPEQVRIAGSLGVWGLVADGTENALLKGGVREEAIDMIFEIAETITEADIDKLEKDHGENAEEVIINRIKTKLVEGGLPKDEGTLSLALVLLESSSNETNAAYEWVEQKLY
jgi:hypothetical protein